MEHDLYQTPWNFLGRPEDLSAPTRSGGWLLPIPYESTTSNGAGTRDGPAAIIAASRQVALYDQEFGGISWERLLQIARMIGENAACVPVFDVVELAPVSGFRAPEFLAAKLVYKLFTYTIILARSGKRSIKRRKRHG